MIGTGQMDRIASKTEIAGMPAFDRPTRVCRPLVSLLAALSVSLLAGCALTKRDSITVGAVPDDYRTNHPIVIAEKEQVIDLPVAAGDRGMTHSHRVALDGFLDSYDRSAAPVLTIVAPVGSGNEVAAADTASDIRHFLRSRGISESRIMMTSYQAPSVDISAPVRVAYTAMKAQTNKCGRWPDDLTNNVENKHYANFGCSYQNNLAAQIADPADLLGPRKQTAIDAQNRIRAIDVYQGRGISDEFLGNSEVDF
jgi:pilus assembly protein CpaD